MMPTPWPTTSQSASTAPAPRKTATRQHRDRQLAQQVERDGLAGIAGRELPKTDDEGARGAPASATSLPAQRRGATGTGALLRRQTGGSGAPVPAARQRNPRPPRHRAPAAGTTGRSSTATPGALAASVSEGELEALQRRARPSGDTVLASWPRDHAGRRLALDQVAPLVRLRARRSNRIAIRMGRCRRPIHADGAPVGGDRSSGSAMFAIRSAAIRVHSS